jgi:GT2 family glycosyltransferase
MDLLTADNFIATGSQLFRRSWLDIVNGFDERYSVIEDVHLMLRVAAAGGQFVHVSSDEPLFFYRQRDEGSLSSNQTAFIEGCLRNARMVERYARNQKQMTEGIREQLIRVYFYGARFYAPRCWDRFNEIWSWIQRLDPAALPKSPAHLRTASRLLGYPIAERVAIAYRRMKHTLGLSR